MNQVKSVLLDIAAGTIEEETEKDVDAEADKAKAKDKREDEDEELRKEKSMNIALRAAAFDALGNAWPSHSNAYETQKQNCEEFYRFFIQHAKEGLPVCQMPILNSLKKYVQALYYFDDGDHAAAAAAESASMVIEGGSGDEPRVALLTKQMAQEILDTCWHVIQSSKVIIIRKPFLLYSPLWAFNCRVGP